MCIVYWWHYIVAELLWHHNIADTCYSLSMKFLFGDSGKF